MSQPPAPPIRLLLSWRLMNCDNDLQHTRYYTAWWTVKHHGGVIKVLYKCCVSWLRTNKWWQSSSTSVFKFSCSTRATYLQCNIIASAFCVWVQDYLCRPVPLFLVENDAFVHASLFFNVFRLWVFFHLFDKIYMCAFFLIILYICAFIRLLNPFTNLFELNSTLCSLRRDADIHYYYILPFLGLVHHTMLLILDEPQKLPCAHLHLTKFLPKMSSNIQT